MRSEAAISATVRHVWRETPRLWGVIVEVPPDVARLYQRPGQYVFLTRGALTVPLALAAAPGEAAAFELLASEGAFGPAGPVRGERWSLSEPNGPGFDLGPAEGRDVLAFAVGSGISAIRGLLETLRKRRDAYRRVVLYAGARSPDDHAYRRLDHAFQEDRIEVVRTVSRPYVQERFLAAEWPLEDAVAYASGTKGMVDGVREVLTVAGLAPDRFVLNL